MSSATRSRGFRSGSSIRDDSGGSDPGRQCGAPRAAAARVVWRDEGGHDPARSSEDRLRRLRRRCGQRIGSRRPERRDLGRQATSRRLVQHPRGREPVDGRRPPTAPRSVKAARRAPSARRPAAIRPSPRRQSRGPRRPALPARCRTAARAGTRAHARRARRATAATPPRRRRHRERRAARSASAARGRLPRAIRLRSRDRRRTAAQPRRAVVSSVDPETRVAKHSIGADCMMSSALPAATRPVSSISRIVDATSRRARTCASDPPSSPAPMMATSDMPDGIIVDLRSVIVDGPEFDRNNQIDNHPNRQSTMVR